MRARLLSGGRGGALSAFGRGRLCDARLCCCWPGLRWFERQGTVGRALRSRRRHCQVGLTRSHSSAGSKRECIPPGCRAASALAAAAGAGEEAAAAALLRPLADAGALACDDCAAAVSPGVAALLAASERCRDAPARARVLDARGAAAVRAYVVATCEPRAILVDACVRLVALREAVESDASEEGTRAQAHAQVAALEALLVTAPLVHALGAGAALWELEDAAFRQLFPTSFAAVSAWLDEAWEAGEAALARARLALEVALESDEAVQRATTRIHISARAKGLFSTFSKLLRDGRGIDGVRDLLGMRVVLEASAPGHEGEVAACYAALDAAREVFEEVPGRGKDYIAQPKRSGYSALHTTFMVDGMSLEVQVRGAAMHVAAESGAASHAAYKLGVKTEPHSDGVPLALPGLAPLPEQEAGVLAMAAEALASVPDLPLDE